MGGSDARPGRESSGRRSVPGCRGLGGLQGGHSGELVTEKVLTYLQDTCVDSTVLGSSAAGWQVGLRGGERALNAPQAHPEPMSAETRF